MLDDYQEDTLNGKAFVRRDYEPANSKTEKYVVELGEEIGILRKSIKPSSRKKLIRCMSDFLMACRGRYLELICWSMDKNFYYGPPYGDKIARQVFEAVQGAGLIEKAYKGAKGVAVRYRVLHEVPKYLSFLLHGEGPVVELRHMKANFKSVAPKKGRRIPLHKFGAEGKRLIEEVEAINKLLMAHPLTSTEGESWASCKRVFNNGRLDYGGRLYGGWQQKKCEERLLMTIDQEPVCEIDIKPTFPKWPAF